MLLKDKVAVITGGAGLNGLGFAAARLTASHGARVVVLDRAPLLAMASPR
jgi:NAD(P)-dependent dehydrogenase (short-subunit alcohol dehydrogenase family)